MNANEFLIDGHDKRLPKILNIGFFGASVTKQQNGFVKYFKQLCNHNILQYGYGGMHLKDAGIIFIDDVLKNKLDYCFIDWFTPCIHFYKKEVLFLYLDTIVSKLLSNGCIPIFLFLRGTNNSISFEEKIRNFDSIVSEYCLPKHIPYFEVYKDPTINCKQDNEILRDIIHTNNVGSELYARAIANYFNLVILDKLDIKTIPIPKETKFNHIKSVPFNKKIATGILIKGNAELIGIYQDIGPFSCFYDVYVDGTLFCSQQSAIDTHCHYIRPTLGFNYSFKESLIISISDKNVDYENIVKIGINWLEYEKQGIFPQQKEFRFHSLYYIGEIEDIKIL